jgi:hypothetical protein
VEIPRLGTKEKRMGREDKEEAERRGRIRVGIGKASRLVLGIFSLGSFQPLFPPVTSYKVGR